MTGVWTFVLKKVLEARAAASSSSSGGQVKKQSTAVSGPEYFGLTNPRVAELIEQMPNADKCLGYVPKKIRGRGLKYIQEEDPMTSFNELSPLQRGDSISNENENDNNSSSSNANDNSGSKPAIKSRRTRRPISAPTSAIPTKSPAATPPATPKTPRNSKKGVLAEKAAKPANANDAAKQEAEGNDEEDAGDGGGIDDDDDEDFDAAGVEDDVDVDDDYIDESYTGEPDRRNDSSHEDAFATPRRSGRSKRLSGPTANSAPGSADSFGKITRSRRLAQNNGSSSMDFERELAQAESAKRRRSGAAASSSSASAPAPVRLPTLSKGISPDEPIDYPERYYQYRYLSKTLPFYSGNEYFAEFYRDTLEDPSFYILPTETEVPEASAVKSEQLEQVKNEETLGSKNSEAVVNNSNSNNNEKLGTDSNPSSVGASENTIKPERVSEPSAAPASAPAPSNPETTVPAMESSARPIWSESKLVKQIAERDGIEVLREMWEFTYVCYLINLLRPVLKLERFSADELEHALANPKENNGFLADLHIKLIKGPALDKKALEQLDPT